MSRINTNSSPVNSDEKSLQSTSKNFGPISFFYSNLLSILLSAIIKRQKIVSESKTCFLAENILDKHSHLCQLLLTTRGSVAAYSNGTDKTIVEGTALQIALSAEDDQLAKILIPYLDKINPELKTQQRQQQFPEGQEEKERIRQAQDAYALQTIIKAIQKADEKECQAVLENEDTNGPLMDALKAFRDYLEPKNVIKTGKQFNMQLFIDALRLYVKKYETFSCTIERNKWAAPKNKLFWCKVIGYIERFLPTCYAQALNDGLHDIVIYYKPLGDSLKLKNDATGKSFSYFPLKRGATDGLGFTYVIYRGMTWSEASALGMVMSMITNLEKYVEKKQQSCGNLCGLVENSMVLAPNALSI